MKSIFSQGRTRCIATVMAIIWLMTLGVSLANACMVDLAQGHHSISTLIRNYSALMQGMSDNPATCKNFPI
jgi:hypothetical protein